MDEKKLAFIQTELEEWGEELDAELKDQLRKFKVGVSDDLFNSITHQVRQAKFFLSFNESGRMRDMGAARSQKANTKIESIGGNNKAFKGRKAAKWYSKTAYGRLNSLISRIMYGYQEVIPEVIKEGLAQ